MVIATGIDIVEVKRISRLMSEYAIHFTNKVFAESETAECTKKRASEKHFAGRFALKEAVLKLLGTGLSGGVRWQDIVTTVDSAGCPSVALRGRAKEIAQKKGIEKIVAPILTVMLSPARLEKARLSREERFRQVQGNRE
jgi:holo-[acyl-carrier protein] synthase